MYTYTCNNYLLLVNALFRPNNSAFLVLAYKRVWNKSCSLSKREYNYFNTVLFWITNMTCNILPNTHLEVSPGIALLPFRIGLAHGELKVF